MPTVEVKIKEGVEQSPKNIFYPGNVVKGDKGAIVLVIYDNEDRYSSFRGVEMSELRYHDCWLKPGFTQFTGTIEITVKP